MLLGDRHLVVAGMMGVGKTTTADALAVRLGRAVRDSDRDLRALFGRSGSDLAARHGVVELHRLESAVLLGALASATPSVAAAAGSVVEDPRCREALRRRAVTVVLEVGVDELLARSGTGDHRRPIDREEFEALQARRRPLFAEVATLVVDGSAPAHEVVAEILTALHPT